MPIWLRHYYIKSIENFIKKRNKAQEKANQSQNNSRSRSTPPKFRRR
jgi:hypothetical protein